MDLNTFERLVREALEIGVKKIVFSGWAISVNKAN